MTPTEFSRLIVEKGKILDNLMRRQLPVIAGRMAKDHFQDNFRKSGFVNGGLHPWKPAKRLSSGNPGASAKYRTLLSGRNHLFSSINYAPGEYRVRIFNSVKYASLHNWGGIANPTVTNRMRRFAWAMFYKALEKSKKSATGTQSRKKGAIQQPENEQARFWKSMALTKKTRYNIRIPQRQFLGESQELSNSIAARTEKEIRNILNL